MQKVEKLNKAQERGRIKIMSRVIKGEINLSPTDKRKSVEMMPLILYQ